VAEGAPSVRLLCLAAVEAMLGGHQRWDDEGKWMVQYFEF